MDNRLRRFSRAPVGRRVEPGRKAERCGVLRGSVSVHPECVDAPVG